MEKPRHKSHLHILLYGCITGVFTGTAVSLFIICAKVIFAFTEGVYEKADTPLVVVCVIMLVLLCCFLTAVVQTLCPAAKGSGIPLAEGAARGMLRVKWLRTAASLVAGSLLAFIAGMPLGSEGPSIGVGGLIGEGVGKLSKKKYGFRRYLITGGASAGLAVAFNAPLTGLCFAVEETHRRFSLQILTVAFSTVLTAVFTSQAIMYGFSFIPYLAGVGVRPGASFLAAFSPAAPSVPDFFKLCGIAVVCGIAAAVIGVLFSRGIRLFGDVPGKIPVPFLRLLPSFALACIFGLIVALSAGSGESALFGVSTESAFGLLIGLMIMRLVGTAMASGSGATGGLFIPMLAIGGLTGTVAAKLCLMCGLDPALAPNVILICISAFFVAVTRSPITAIVLSVELTMSFVNLLPCAIGVGVAAMLAALTRTEPLYERMVDALRDGAPLPDAKSFTISGKVRALSPADGRRVRDILFPYNSLVTSLSRGDKIIVPDGETVLHAGDELTVTAEKVDEKFFLSQIDEYIDTGSTLAPPDDVPLAATAKNG